METVSNLNVILSNIDSKKLYVLYVPISKDRRIIHQYLEKFYPHVRKIGLTCDCFPIKETCISICYECNIPIEMEYHTGIMDNNIDEYYSASCDKCGNHFTHECSYDSYSSECFSKTDSNVIVIGNYINYNNKITRTTEDISHGKNVINSMTMYIIDIPQIEIRKKELSMFISSKIKEYIV